MEVVETHLLFIPQGVAQSCSEDAFIYKWLSIRHAPKVQYNPAQRQRLGLIGDYYIVRPERAAYIIIPKYIFYQNQHYFLYKKRYEHTILITIAL